VKWNKAYNLTAITDPQEMLSKHIDDSLVVNPFLQGSQIIDVGTGAGLPGIPLAIVNPDKLFTLLDSNGKKIRFIQQAITILKLTNVTAVHARVEDFKSETRFDSVLSRAFASIYDMLTLTQHLINDNGVFLAMKGTVPTDELNQLPAGFKVENIQPLCVPGLKAERCLVVIKKTQD
jgi:16S rRNA (guanine527-N7)-methyltransferase